MTERRTSRLLVALTVPALLLGFATAAYGQNLPGTGNAGARRSAAAPKRTVATAAAAPALEEPAPTPSTSAPTATPAPSAHATGTRAVATRTPARGTVQTTQRTFANGVRATVRVRTTEEIAAEHATGRVVTFREGPGALIRRTMIDGPVHGGTFTRTTRTLVLERTPEALAKNPSAPAPWTRRTGDFEPHWSPEKIDSLLSTKPLGPVYESSGVRARLFAPNAREVHLVLDDTGEKFRAVPDRAGVWEANTGRAPDKLYGQRYHFEIDGKPISDPYAHATTGDYGPAKFVNLSAYKWHDENFHAPERQVVISEVHVKDMTASPSAPVPDKVRGTYAALGSKPIVEHYQDLGVTGIELLPIHQYDFKSGDKGTINHWGYMTTQYFSPELRYAVSADHAPEELMGAVDAYHQKGVSVIMDVVYNHTATGPEIAFNALGKTYYYRIKTDGKLANGAGTGNEFASEKPMVQKLIVDSLRHFVTNYHIDGFRFDLGSLLDVRTMRVIDRVLPSRVFLTGEPWAAEWDRAKWGKGDLSGPLADTRWSVWNDDYRNAVNGFVAGAANDDARSKLMTAIAGSAKPYGFALRPSQSVNYLESHDELTVADRVGGDKQRDLLGAVLLLTSQGTPMIGHGQEFMRSKQGIANAHNLDNEVSHVDWSLKQKNADVYAVYKQLIALRRDLPQFRYDQPLTDKEIKWVMPEHDMKSALGYLLPAPEAAQGQSRAPDVFVMANSDKQRSAWFKLPHSGDWQVVVHGTRVGSDSRGSATANGYYEVPPGAAAVVIQKPASR